jgi:hypothetical protein
MLAASIAVVDYLNVNASEDEISIHNYEHGRLRIAIAAAKGMKNGNVINLGIRIKDKEAKLNISGIAKLNDNFDIQLDATVRQIPAQFALSNNYPNPFNPTTNINYQLAEDAQVTLKIYNMLGQEVKTIISEAQEAGYYTAKWDGNNDFGARVSSGVYIYSLHAGSFVATKKMNLIK